MNIELTCLTQGYIIIQRCLEMLEEHGACSDVETQVGRIEFPIGNLADRLLSAQVKPELRTRKHKDTGNITYSEGKTGIDRNLNALLLDTLASNCGMTLPAFKLNIERTLVKKKRGVDTQADDG